MIIATGSVNIDENAKLAEQAGAGNEEALKDLKTSMDGKITVSTQAPFNDGTDHADGDLWLIQSDNVTTAMYTYGKGGWSEKQWDQDTLSVKELSALTANLGTVNAGNINGVQINSSYFEGGSIHILNGNYEYWLDQNGLHSKGPDGNSWLIGGQVSVRTGSSTSAQSVSLASDGIELYKGGLHAYNGTGVYVDSGLVSTPNVSMSRSTMNSSTGAFYFESGYGGSGNSGADLHAASFNKMSQLSVKRNIQDITGEYALAQIMGTDVKRYDYKLSDNSKQTNIGPIIDDENAAGSKQYGISADMVNSEADGVSVDNEVGLLMAAVKELTKRNSDLQLRITQLERKGNV